MKRSSKSNWSGDLAHGRGYLSTESLTLNKARYSFDSRFAEAEGTNPEELLAAAHAGCFTIGLVFALSQAKYVAGELETTAEVNVDMAKGGITDIELTLNASMIEGLSQQAFTKIAMATKENCLISKALAGLKISLVINYN